MAPMTRSRADDAGVPNELAPVYHAQRAGAGLIITEGTSSSPMAKGYRLKFSLLSIMETSNSID